MNTSNKSHLLSLNHPTINTDGLEQLVSMWSVLSKCKNHLEEGTRLENMSWRLWHQKHQHQQQHFVQPILSLSAGNPRHEVSQTKQTQNNHVPDKDDWSFSSITITSSSSSQQQQPKPTTTKAETAGSTNALVPLTTTTNSSRTTTPSLSNSYQYGDEENDGDNYDDDYDDDDFDDDDFDDDIYDDDDLYDDNDNYIYDEAEEAFMHNHRTTEKLRPYRSTSSQAPSSRHYFKKTLPQPRRQQQPSLLSALFKTSSSGTPPQHSSSRNTFNTTTSRVPNGPPDHFLKKELTESLRDNVLWEHDQQKTLYTTNTTRSHPSYYHHPPPSSTYQSPYHHRHNNNRPPFKKTMAPSDQGWLESFHGW